jgi:hypothetical protein
MPYLTAEALETDPYGCAFLASVLLEPRSSAGRSLRPHALHGAAARLAALFRQARRTQAQRRIEEALAGNPVADLCVIAQASKLSFRKTQALLRRLELDGVVLLHTTSTGATVVRLVTP